MYTARLYIGDCLYKTMAVSERRDYIVIYTNSPLRLASDSPSPSAILDFNKMVFRINYEVREAPYIIRYDFDAAVGSLRLSEYEVYEIMPTLLNEPDENVNLNKLKEKLRDNIKAKELLTRYYAS